MSSMLPDPITAMFADMHDERVANELVVKLTSERVGLIAYAHMKLDAGDFHAVADAAMDLREIDAKLSVLRA